MRRRLVGRIASGETLTSQLSATQRKRRPGDQPARQNGKSSSTRSADATAHPDPLMLVVVSEAKPPSVTHDGVIPAQRTAPGQEAQRNHPRLDVVFGLRQCDKKNHGCRVRKSLEEEELRTR